MQPPDFRLVSGPDRPFGFAELTDERTVSAATTEAAPLSSFTTPSAVPIPSILIALGEGSGPV